MLFYSALHDYTCNVLAVLPLPAGSYNGFEMILDLISVFVDGSLCFHVLCFLMPNVYHKEV